jgi:hypothetical protein
MKRTRLLLAAAAGLVLAAGVARAQSSATATATASARVLTKIQLTKTSDLNFGDLVAGAALGTAVVNTAGVRSSTGGVSLAVGTVSQAAFTVQGEPNKSYTIAIPASVTISSGANNMTVNTFTSNLASPATLPAGGSQALNIGATLNVGANQATGSYTNTFNVTIAYN